MRLRWLCESTNDLARIRAYIARDNAAAAEDVRRRIVETVRQLQELPRLGRLGPRDTRQLVVAGLPYIIVYRIVGEELLVLGIFHGARER